MAPRPQPGRTDGRGEMAQVRFFAADKDFPCATRLIFGYATVQHDQLDGGKTSESIRAAYITELGVKLARTDLAQD